MHLTIGQRIVAGFASIIVLTMALGAYQYLNIGQMRDLAQGLVGGEVRGIVLIGDLSAHQRNMRIFRERAIALHLLAARQNAAADAAEAEREWETARQQTVAAIEELERFAGERQRQAPSESRAQLWAEVVDNVQQNRRVLEEVSAAVRDAFERLNSDDTSQLRQRIEVIDERRERLNVLLDNTEALVGQLVDRTEQSIDEQYTNIIQASLVAVVAAAILGLVLAYLIYRSITRPLSDFMVFVERVGRGDLTVRTENTGGDELGQLGVYLNEMADNLAESATQTQVATEQLNSATAELRASAQQQASSTSEQNAAIQQITSTLEEITQSGAQMTERAKTVATAAKSTSSASKAGLDAAAETARAMTSIKEQAEAVATNIVGLTEKTQSVGEIVASVNDIAERSDLLALNAAIEASAAGEYGRSFSVVAEEMKVLAGQAKEATAQVRTLLGDIQQGINSSVMQTEEAVKRTESGQRQTEEMEATINTLAENIEQSVATFEQIVAATNQQQIGIEQVSESIQSIRIASEQMTTGTRDLEQSAGSLAALGEQLQKSVERYTL